MLAQASGYFFLGAGCEKNIDYCLYFDFAGILIGPDNDVV